MQLLMIILLCVLWVCNRCHSQQDLGMYSLIVPSTLTFCNTAIHRECAYRCHSQYNLGMCMYSLIVPRTLTFLDYTAIQRECANRCNRQYGVTVYSFIVPSTLMFHNYNAIYLEGVSQPMQQPIRLTDGKIKPVTQLSTIHHRSCVHSGILQPNSIMGSTSSKGQLHARIWSLEWHFTQAGMKTLLTI